MASQRPRQAADESKMYEAARHNCEYTQKDVEMPSIWLVSAKLLLRGFAESSIGLRIAYDS